MSVEIVKVQVPLNLGEGPVEVLIYDQNRRHVVVQPLVADTAKKLGADKKGYFKATWSSVVGWGISERVSDQDW